MDLDRVDVVLVRPARAANVASACRAMKNMGLKRLRLVGDLSLDRPEDRALAYGAWELLDQAQRFSSLGEAVADSTLVAGTTGRDEAGAWTPRRLAEDGAARAGPGRTALVFGPESSGLTRHELQLCHVLVRIPTSDEHSSLNLAQAVLVLAYEVRLSISLVATDVPEQPEDRAEAVEIEACLAALQAGLLSIGYLNPDDPGGIVAEIRGLLARAGATRRELNLLRGMARQMDWAGSIASRTRRSG